MDFARDFRILEWIGADERGQGYSIYFLKSRFSNIPEALVRLRQVARQLEQEPDYWQHVIRATGWRLQLIGCYALIVAHNKNYLEALNYALNRHCWVSPQIAVTMGILHPAEAVAYLEQWLNPNSDDPKRAAAAYQILVQLGSSTAKDFDVKTIRDKPDPASSNENDSHWCNEFDIGMTVASTHWEAWQHIINGM